MVLLSASICTKAGKPLVARQFMEINRSRVEGLLAAFPKLRGSEEQHTFVETETVRYVYRPMEQLYMVLITTKNSNILEDLETLRLFCRVVPEICRSMTETEVVAHAFDLIFAFDEIIALGYPENVNLSQIRTYTEMHSHEEAIFKMVKENKEREAKDLMKRKAKELQMQKRDLQRQGRGGSDAELNATLAAMRAAATSVRAPEAAVAATPAAASSSSSTASKKPGKGMKLGGKAKASEFVEALIAEGEQVVPEAAVAAMASPAASSTAPVVPPSESIHIKVDEKITLRANRDGGLEEMEVKGTMFVSVFDPEKAKMQLRIRKDAAKNVPYQTHPNVDKKAFGSDDIIRLKSVDRPFPTNSEVGVVKWRIQTTDESQIPLSINCWPTINPDGSCDVNIEYELNAKELELQNVTITIPLPSSGGSPKVASADGDYNYNAQASVLIWSIPLVDKENANGAMEFSVSSNDANDFFPVLVDFSSDKTYAGLAVDSVELIDGDALKFSSDIRFSAESYEIV